SSMAVRHTAFRATPASDLSSHDIEGRIQHGELIVRAVRRVAAVDQAVDVAQRKVHPRLPQSLKIVDVLAETQAFVESANPTQNATAEHRGPKIGTWYVTTVQGEHPPPWDRAGLQTDPHAPENRVNPRIVKHRLHHNPMTAGRPQVVMVDKSDNLARRRGK